MSDQGRESRQTRLETFKQGHLSTLEAHRPSLRALVALAITTQGENHPG